MELGLSFGAWLRERRRALDLTQRELGGLAACAAETIRKIEGGRARPSRALADRLIDALDVPPEARGAARRAARTPLPRGAATSARRAGAAETPAAPAHPQDAEPSSGDQRAARERLVLSLQRGLGAIALRDLPTAARALRESLALAQQLGSRVDIGLSLSSLAALATAQGRPATAARLLGAAWGQLHLPGDSLGGAERSRLDPATFAQAWQEGQALPVAEAIDEALASARQACEPAVPDPPSGALGLTQREVEVLRLVAQGMTNRAVAEQLIISPRTVNAHLSAIYGKLGVGTRAGATRVALERGII